jgi:hypothetical protein
MTDCERGCLLHGLHTPDCGCHNDCPEHNNHCEGCLPRPADIGHYCQRCAFRLRDDITTLPDLITATYQMPGGRLAPPDRANNGDPTRRATKVDQLSPSPALDTADEAAWWLNRWAVGLADLLAERGPFEYRHHDGVPVPNPTAEARYLTSRLPQLCSHPVVNELADEARQFVHTLTRATGTDSADQRIPTRCPSCNQRTLVRPNGEDHVTCRNSKCGNVWQSEHLGLLAREATA